MGLMLVRQIGASRLGTPSDSEYVRESTWAHKASTHGLCRNFFA
jgi:hypothetical protein